MAEGHLEHCIEELRIQKESRTEAFSRVGEELAQLDAVLQDLKLEQSYNELYTRHLDDPEDQKPRRSTSSHAWREQLAHLGKVEDKKATQRNQDILAKKAATDQLKYDRQEHKYIINRAGMFLDRNTATINLVTKVLKATEDNRESLLLSSIAFAQGFYYVCCVQGLGSQILTEIETVFADDALHNSDRVKIVNSSELYHEWETSRQYHNLLILTLDKVVSFQSYLNDAKGCMLYQYGVLKEH